MHHLWGLSFSWKCSKFNIDSKNGKKFPEKDFCFYDNSIWIDCVKKSLLRKECILLARNVLTTSLKIFHVTKRDFLSKLASQGSINMVKALSFRFPKCLGTFTMLLLERCSERRFFIQLSNHVFLESVIWEIHQVWGSCSFWK